MQRNLAPSNPQLKSTQTASDPFYLNGGDYFALLSDYTGTEIWLLEIENPDGDWIGTGVTFTNNGIKVFKSTQLLRYRLSGGDVGAKAWVFPGYSQGMY